MSSSMPVKRAPATRIRFSRDEWLHYLMQTSDEKICASCWATQFKSFLDMPLGKIIDLFFEIHMFIFRFILFQNSKPVCQTGHPTITSWWPAKIANAIRTTKASWWPAIVHVLGMAVICSIANSLQVSERRCGCDRIFQLQAVLAISRFRGPWWLTGKKLFLCEPPTSVLTCAGCGIVFLEAVCQPCKICVTLSS